MQLLQFRRGLGVGRAQPAGHFIQRRADFRRLAPKPDEERARGGRAIIPAVGDIGSGHDERSSRGALALVSGQQDGVPRKHDHIGPAVVNAQGNGVAAVETPAPREVKQTARGRTGGDPVRRSGFGQVDFAGRFHEVAIYTIPAAVLHLFPSAAGGGAP
jgi:hypothetical protein